MTDDYSSDEYSDWDAAYVVGSLSATHRRDYERHLASCDACSVAVAELAGMPGLLSKLSASEASALFETRQTVPMPQTLLPRLVRSARRRQLRVRGLIAAGIVAAAAAAAVIALIVPLVFAGEPSTPANDRVLVPLSQVTPNPLSASIRLSPESWGTSIHMHCSYGSPSDAAAYGAGEAAPVSRGYSLYVTDSSGTTTEVATWWAGPGSTVEQSAATTLPIGQISSVDVRSVDGTVLLKGTVS
jgi:hypothetical protein